MDDTNTNKVSGDKPEVRDSGNDNPVESQAASETMPQRPLSLEVQRWRDPQSKEWHAHAFAKVTPTLRTSGLLHTLPAEELKTLLCILTFTTTHGECRPTATQVAHALDISEAKARRRLEHLLSFQWQGRSLITLLHSEDGVDAYLPALGNIAPPDIAYLEQPPQVPTAPVPRRGISPLAAPAPALSSTQEPTEGAEKAVLGTEPVTKRQQIIGASQRKYGRPREEVEQMIVEQMGWTRAPSRNSSSATAATPRANRPLSPEEQELRERLAATGMDTEGIDRLLEHYSHEQIERQLSWLPHRDARNPAAFLIAAVEHDYEAPLTLRQNPGHQQPRGHSQNQGKL